MNTIPVVPLSLFDDHATGHPAYLACRDHRNKRETRARLEAAWDRFRDHMPEKPAHFVKEFRANFHERSWELYLRTMMTDAGLTLEPAQAVGPDLCVRLASGARCWIEAVVANAGTGAHRAWEPAPTQRNGSLPPDDNHILRYRNALEAKLSKLEQYRAGGIVAAGDAFIVAVSQGAIEWSDMFDDMTPAMARAVFPIGASALQFEAYSKSKPREVTLERFNVFKANGAAVATDFFLDARTAAISGVLFDREALWNMGWSTTSDLRLIHRPNANVSVPLGEIPTRGEMWVDATGELLHRGSCARYGVYSK